MYANNSWPSKYLIDPEGQVRHHHIGEGGYAETEEAIRRLIEETGINLDHIDANEEEDPEFDDAAYAADPARRITRELYAGYRHNETLPSSAFATLVGGTPAYIMHEKYYHAKDTDTLYRDPGEQFNHFIYLQGLWRNGSQSINPCQGHHRF